mgnify:CR=1 FL=1
MRSIVAGAAGFIGSHLCETLLKAGEEVIGLDNLTTGNFDNVKLLKQYPNFKMIICDITYQEEIAELYLKDIDYIYHMASPASPVDYQEKPFITMDANTKGTENLLRLCLYHKAKLLFASTSEIYGDPLEHPQKESYWGNVSTTGPRSVYDEAKRFGETLCVAYRNYRGVDSKIVRIFNTYGPRMRSNDGRVIPNFVNQALNKEPLTIYGTGLQTRSFCYVSDLVKGLISLMTSDISGPVNLGNDSEMNMLELANLVNKYTGNDKAIVYRPLPKHDPTRRKPDLTLAKSTLYYAPVVPFEEGIQKTISWFRQADSE